MFIESLILLFGSDFVLAELPITFQSSYTWMEENCTSFMSNISSVQVVSGEQLCAAFCASSDKNCRGYIFNAINQTCDMLHINNHLVCSSTFASVKHTLKIQAYKPVTKMGIYIGIPKDGTAYPFSNINYPEIPIPQHPDWLEMTIAYRNGILGCTGDKKCWLWKFGTNEWSQFASPKVLHYQGRMVLLEGKPTIIGGSNVPAPTGPERREVEEYEETDNQWHFKKGMPVATKNFGAVALNNGTKVFVLGGVRNGGATIINQVYTYELITDTWTDLNEPIPVHNGLGGPLSALITLPDSRNGILIVGGTLDLGGYSYSVSRSAYFMDLATMKWENLASFETTNIAVYNGNMVQIGDSLFVIPVYENELRQVTKNILVRNMSNMNNSWVIHDVSERFSLKESTQIPLTTTEHVMEWIGN